MKLVEQQSDNIPRDPRCDGRAWSSDVISLGDLVAREQGYLLY